MLVFLPWPQVGAVVAHLEVKVRLLESGSGHGLSPGLLASRPDSGSVRCLLKSSLLVLCDAQRIGLALCLGRGLGLVV